MSIITPGYPPGEEEIGAPPPAPLPELYLEFCSATDSRYTEIRKRHYVVNKGCHGQQVHFMIWYKSEVVGIISGGGAVYASAWRDEFFGINTKNRQLVLNGIIDNIVFRLENHERNLGSRVLSLWEKVVPVVWKELYGAKVFGFETFIVREGLMHERITEKKDSQGRLVREVTIVPDEEGNVRRGNMYKASNWFYAGETSGNTKGHDGIGLTGGIEGNSFLRKSTPIKSVYCKWVSPDAKLIKFKYKSSWKAGSSIGTPLEKKRAKKKNRIRKDLMGKIFFILQGKVTRQ